MPRAVVTHHHMTRLGEEQPAFDEHGDGGGDGGDGGEGDSGRRQDEGGQRRQRHDGAEQHEGDAAQSRGMPPGQHETHLVGEVVRFAVRRLDAAHVAVAVEAGGGAGPCGRAGIGRATPVGELAGCGDDCAGGGDQWPGRQGQSAGGRQQPPPGRAGGEGDGEEGRQHARIAPGGNGRQRGVDARRANTTTTAFATSTMPAGVACRAAVEHEHGGDDGDERADDRRNAFTRQRGTAPLAQRARRATVCRDGRPNTAGRSWQHEAGRQRDEHGNAHGGWPACTSTRPHRNHRP